jgi:beta-lactamase regulating signal transducer with metallopeptidase domain
MNDLVMHFESSGRTLAAWLGPMNVWTAALLVGALLLDRALAHHARASWRLALYAPIALRLALPLGWSIHVARAPQVMTFLTPRPDGDLPAVTPVTGGSMVSWHAALAVAYVAVTLVLAVLGVLARVRLARALRTATVLDLGPFPTGRPVVQHEQLGPMAVGLVSPTIVVPRRLVEEGGEAALACVLRHELAHVRRGDAWLSAALQLLTALAWPVIPVWLAVARVRHLMELACDEAALQDADASERRRYGHALLDIAEWDALLVSQLGAGELHFGSTLRARVEALASQKHWPRALQVGFVVAVAAGFAACSSVSPAPASGAQANDAQDESLMPLSKYQAKVVVDGITFSTFRDLQTHCPHFIERVQGGRNGEGWRWWISGGSDGIPADEAALCRSPELVDEITDMYWSSEAHNAIGQMARDTAAAYEASFKTAGQTKGTLCPSASPEPAQPQAPGALYTPTDQDWTSPGWECIHFSMTAPFYFQYAITTEGNRNVITAHAQRRKGNRTLDVSMTLLSEVQPNGVLNIAPSITETWKEVQ